MNETSMEMQRHAMDSWQVIKNRFGPILLSTLLIFSIAAIITYIMPRKYRGRVEMKIERKADKVRVGDRDGEDTTIYSDNALKTEFETITKAETLYPVIEKFDLVKRWNMPDRRAALGKLLGNLDPQAMLKSDFVVIEYFDEDPKQAAEIANAVAESYMTKRVEMTDKGKERALKVVETQITNLEQQARMARVKMLQAQKDAGITGGFFSGGPQARNPGSQVQTGELSLENMREQDLYKLNSNILSWKAELSELGKLTGEELIERFSALKIENQTIAQLYPELQKAKTSRQGYIAGGLGAKHPTIVRLDAEIQNNTTQLASAAKQHLLGLQNKLDSAEESKRELEGYNKDQKNQTYDKQGAYTIYLTAQRDLEQIESMQLKAREKYNDEQANQAISKTPATIWQNAEPESSPAKPRVMLNLSLGGIIGLLFGLGLAFALEYMDTSVKSLDDVERFLGVPVLAVIPKDVGVLHRSSGFSPDAEAYRILRTNIEFNRRNANANCITVVSGGAGEGKSTTLTNLAFVCAQGGYNVLLIDGDLRRPRLHTLFDTSNHVGLTNYLTTDVQLEDVVLKTQVDNLYFLPSGVLPADSAGILNSQSMSDLIADVKSRFDLVLIDSPPILGVSDASVLANEADMTIIVVQHRKLPRQMLMRVKQAVDNVGGNVLGVVLNNVDIRSDSQYSYYTSYYTYYSPTNLPPGAEQGKRKRKKKDGLVNEVVSAGSPRNQGGDVF